MAVDSAVRTWSLRSRVALVLTQLSVLRAWRCAHTAMPASVHTMVARTRRTTTPVRFMRASDPVVVRRQLVDDDDVEGDHHERPEREGGEDGRLQDRLQHRE